MDKPMFDPKAVDTTPKHTPPSPVSTDRPLFDPKAAAAVVEERKQAVVDLYQAPLGPLKTWSFSGLMTFEQCPYRRYLNQVEGAREPSGPAADRGSQLHTAIEDYIQGVSDELSKEVKGFRTVIEDLREKYIDGIVEVEGDWGFTRDWTATGWTADDVWARIKLDVIEHESDTSARIRDWKSGKKFGNEVKHATQLTIYAIGAFMRYPNLEYVEGEMNYIDKHDKLAGKYTRDQALLLKPTIERRALVMTTATDFPPKPSAHNCRWCKLKEPLEGEDTARCQWGVSA